MLLGTGGGGFSASASSAATSGPATQGDVALHIGGIQTGGSSGVPAWAIVAGVVLAIAAYLYSRRRS